MTASIIMRRSDDPTTCMCCGRRAASIGVAKPRAPVTTWTCDNSKCIQGTKGLLMATTADFDIIERRALDTVAKDMVETLLQRAMTAMMQAGATDLTALTIEQVDMAMDGFFVSGEMHGLVKDLILAFGDAMRADLASNAPPF
jgi:hypothetical protein